LTVHSSSHAEKIKTSKLIKELEVLVGPWERWKSASAALTETMPLLHDPDPSLRSLAEEEYVALQQELSSLVQDVLPLLLIPSSPTQDVSALVEIKAGAGGEEAGLFAGDLLRMYTRYVDLWGRDISGRGDEDGGSGKGWKTNIISESFATTAGGRAAYKEVTLEVKGRGAYDTFRWETGVHRVQRVPATETTGRMHTSAVAVVVSLDP